MVTENTLLMCQIVLNCYLNVLTEYPDMVSPEIRERISTAYSEIRKIRRESFLKITREVRKIPTENENASLLSFGTVIK